MDGLSSTAVQIPALVIGCHVCNPPALILVVASSGAGCKMVSFKIFVLFRLNCPRLTDFHTPTDGNAPSLTAIGEVFVSLRGTSEAV